VGLQSYGAGERSAGLGSFVCANRMDMHSLQPDRAYMAGDARIDGQLETWIRQGIERDERYTPEEILEGLKSGKFQVFRYPEGCVITQITGHNRLLIFLLAGKNLDKWKADATEDLRAYAHIRGIGVIEAYCRPGLEKMLADCGWRKEQVVMRLREAHSGRRPVR